MTRNWLLILGFVCLCCGMGMTSLPARSAPITASAPANATPAANRAHTVLKQVLSRGEFQRYLPHPGTDHRSESAFLRWLRNNSAAFKQWWTRTTKPVKDFFNRIGRWLRHHLPQGSSAGSGTMSVLGKILLYTIYVIAGAAVLFLLGLIVYHILLWQRRREEERKVSRTDDRPVKSRKLEPTFWEKSLQEAEQLWQQGQEREAVRVLYRACLVLLDARGVLRYDESRANGEVLRELRRQGRGGIQQALSPIVRSFDRAWYGFLPLTGADFTSTLEHTRQFRASVVEGSDA